MKAFGNGDSSLETVLRHTVSDLKRLAPEVLAEIDKRRADDEKSLADSDDQHSAGSEGTGLPCDAIYGSESLRGS